MSDKNNVPSDIVIVVALVSLTCVFILLPFLSDTPIRTILGLPMVLFLPGYALIAALFPKKDDLDGIERVALSFGLSIAVVPLIGLGLNYTPWGIRLLPILVSLSFFTVVMCVVAVLRRRVLPEDEEFSVPFSAAYLSLREELSKKPDNRLDRILSIILVLSILASIVTLAYVVVTPKEGEKFTEFYILGMDGMADGYPTNFTLGQSGNVLVGVVNHEYEITDYSLELLLENDSSSVEHERLYLTLGHNETWEGELSFTPESVGEDMKLQFLLYKNGNMTVPYRDLHLWIDVMEG
ncbi:DUF1616 domain-containing protein [Methanococcoides alaskense]|uniref:Membrane protein n=1 Tax=Methanococcoides alaskense TaxID=325778 RepID=A0AA90ZC55_9EURY|nr:DUF1616 domain-containing protein [Methanococcoides alaskense]MDA0524660.1 DUF1616 domain-containing protein [Methanococcoides alaskense]MDR6222413.1 putative membrane protein [Methanococcoides alaskense]